MKKPKIIKPCPTCGCLPLFAAEFDIHVWFYHGFRGHTESETAKLLGVSRTSVSRAVRRAKKIFPTMYDLKNEPTPPPPRPTQFFGSVHSPLE